MKVSETANAILAASGKSKRQISLELGHDEYWAKTISNYRPSPQLATIADMARAAGYRIDIVNNETNEVLGTVEPPCVRKGAPDEEE